MPEYLHSLGVVLAAIAHAIPMLLAVAAGFTSLGLFIAFCAFMEGGDIEWPDWLLLVVCGPVALLLLIPWCMAVYR
jgi:phosphotransferase system  glucose/maltose/N-acetylglucosamine-specific IIC component